MACVTKMTKFYQFFLKLVKSVKNRRCTSSLWV